MAPSSARPQKEFSFRTRQRAWDDLKSRKAPLDVVIVGGGIAGAGLLRELALRGLTEGLLVEKADFASGTSGASSKLIHAGIRYLEQAWDRLKEGRVVAAWRDFRFVLGASAERRRLGRIAPGLIRPKRIFLVLGRESTRNAVAVLAGTWLYYVIQIFQGQFFRPPTAALRRGALAREFPELASSRVRAVFSFWDSETDDARLVIENLQSANDLGVPALNYVELAGFETQGELVALTLKNRESGETASVRARVLINAAGAHVDEVAARGGIRRRTIDRVAGAHIDVHPPVTERSFYVTASDSRLVFVLARNEDGLVFSRIGTTERALGEGESSDAPKASDGEVAYLLNLARTYFPRAILNASTVIGIDAGIRPLQAQSHLSAFQKSREHAIVRDGRVCHVVGVKLTDYRRVAVEVVETIPWTDLGVTLEPSATDAPLRTEGGRIYAETTPEQVVLRTCVLHWDDYLLRRRGAAPRVARRDNPQDLKKELDEVSRILGWPMEVTAAEERRATPPSLPE